MRQTIRFGPYTIDPDQFVLRKHNIRVKLQRQPFKLLLLLIRHKGSVVNRDAMIQELWGDGTQVDFDRGLNFCISQIRTALNDDSASPKYIETIHREGYRFLGEVEVQEPAPVAPPAESLEALTPAQTGNGVPLAGRRRFTLFAAAGLAGAGGVGFLVNKFQRRPHVASRPPVPLTGLAGRLLGPSFSPDARQVAFSWGREDRLGQAEIHVKMIGSAETLQLTSGETLDEFPRWARDGKSIFFTREEGPQAGLWQVPALGGAAKRVGSLGPSPLYGYSLRRPFDLLPSGGFLASIRTPGVGWRILRIRENGEPGDAVTSPPKRYYDHQPTVSPDGRSFVFLRSESGGRRELHVQSLAERSSTRLAGLAWANSAGWTRDGQSVLWCAELRDTWGIWLVPVSGGEPRLVHGASARVLDISLSDRGDLAAYVEENPRFDLWRATLHDAEEPRPLIVSSRAHDSPRFSPDGKRLTYYGNRSGVMQVWIANADGTGAHPLTKGLYPSWSPDGKRLAYLMEDGIHTIAAQGGAGETVLSPDGFYKSRPMWSTDGRWIFFESNRGGGEVNVWKVPATHGAGSPVQMTKSGGMNPQIFDGFLYYRKRQAGTMRVPLEGGREELIAPEGTAHTAMPGGLYVLTRDRRLLLIDYRTRAARPLRQLDNAAGGSSLAISPDEKHVVYAHQADAGHEIMLMRDVDWR